MTGSLLADLARHGYVVLFVWLTAEMLGAPLPAVPILLAVGVLTATGQLSFATALLLGVVGCLLGDTAWYGLGKRWGARVLGLLCKVSLEPEACVRRGSNFISRFGSRTLLLAKFVPGVSTVSVPLMASSGTSLATFLFYDLLGSALYVGTYLTAGRVVGNRLDKLAALQNSISNVSIGLAVLVALVFVVRRYELRRAFQRLVRMSRITPQELRELNEGGKTPFIVDLRHPVDMLADPQVIPGAIRLTPGELAARQSEIPRDREIILYCT
jgi:membrane protein DedA with SNARE-associated domain